MAKIDGTIFLLVLWQVYCEGFDFTLHSHSPDAKGTSKDRQKCGLLQCTETLPDPSSSNRNNSRKLTSITISKNHPTVGGIDRRWQQLASISSQQTTLNRVSNGIRVIGQLSDQQGEVSLDLFKIHDCQESQFSCVAVYVDSQGQTSVTKSIVGKGVNFQQDLSTQFGTIKASLPSNNVLSDEQPNLPQTSAQLVTLFQSKFDSILTRLDDSLRSLENRLEDKIADMRGALDKRVNDLENRLGDKLSQIHIRVTEGFGRAQSTSSGGGVLSDQLALKFDGLENNLGDKMDAFVNKILKNPCEGKENVSSHLALAITLKSIEANLTSYDVKVDKLETDVNKCAAATTAEDAKLTSLISSVSSLSSLTQSLTSQVNTFTNSYAGGALVPVEEFSDPFGIGRKEWKLIFRGTAYINVELYPAYLHGTGIPLDVEEGCKQFNRSLPCVNHYRNREAFDNWDGIDEVLLAIYKDDQMVQNVVFNGKGSTYTSWFAAGRVILSSWDDLTTQPHNFFSIKGYESTSAGHTRRFHINRDYDKGCNGFKGWFTVKDSVIDGCAAEKTVAMPMFQYAAGKTFAEWNGLNDARADAIGIFLKYE
ncbi:hypothetical protein RRG08_036323 [Elysia crispata]|uniref:Uncharacterized protein n=1 Tax=Elysia crispata TaxID=231223 RepID=A0AAE0ZP08_9GAST|nr:hypothetical protein RRG08_036323 [Elysia crispata]